MSEDTKNQPVAGEQKSRRSVLKTAAQVAITAPAVGILLSATTKPAQAAAIDPYTATQQHILDDFTYGNNDEDIDFGPTLDDVT